MALDTGMASCLVLTGETTPDDVAALDEDHQPTYVLDRVDRLIPQRLWDELGCTENKEATYKPAFGDIVDFTYSLSDIYGKEIYSKEDTKVITYYVDKQELFQGLRQAIKLLKENEEAVFFFPSEIAFGYHGDKEKIGVNKPIRAQVHILKITPAPPPPPSTSESIGLIKCDFE